MGRTFFGRARSIAGAAFIGLGSFVFYQSPIHLGQLAGAIHAEAPGVLPGLILAMARGLQAYGADHQRFLQVLVLHTLTAIWPLLLVIAGTVLSRDSFTDNANALAKKDCGRVDLSAGRSTSE